MSVCRHRRVEDGLSPLVDGRFELLDSCLEPVLGAVEDGCDGGTQWVIAQVFCKLVDPFHEELHLRLDAQQLDALVPSDF